MILYMKYQLHSRSEDIDYNRRIEWAWKIINISWGKGISEEMWRWLWIVHGHSLRMNVVLFQLDIMPRRTWKKPIGDKQLCFVILTLSQFSMVLYKKLQQNTES